MKSVSRNVMKAHCEDIGMALRILFWIWAIWMAGMVIYGGWMLCHPADSFTMQTLDTGKGLIGVCGFANGYEMTFPVNVLDTDALEHPKLAFGIGYLAGWAMNTMYLLILWNLRIIFRNIDTFDTPFVEKNATAISRIGILLIFAGHIKSAVLPLLCIACGIGSGGSGSMVDLNSLLIGGIMICLSYIFAYGTSLQQESDETL